MSIYWYANPSHAKKKNPTKNNNVARAAKQYRTNAHHGADILRQFGFEPKRIIVVRLVNQIQRQLDLHGHQACGEWCRGRGGTTGSCNTSRICGVRHGASRIGGVGNACIGDVLCQDGVGSPTCEAKKTISRTQTVAIENEKL